MIGWYGNIGRATCYTRDEWVKIARATSSRALPLTKIAYSDVKNDWVARLASQAVG